MAFSSTLAWFGRQPLVLAAAALFSVPVLADDALPVKRADMRPAAEQAQELIERLGSPHYATREKAAGDLAQLGLEAFDALQAAQQHDDVEIAERARYLLHSMKVIWTRPSDTAEVKRLLKDYRNQADLDRRTRIGQLAQLNDAEGIDALCRMARYEMSNILAKEAALAIMTRPQFSAPEHRDALRRAIEEQIGESKRDAAQWIVAFERTLAAPAAELDGWKARIRTERQNLTVFGEDQVTNSQVVRDILRWHAEQLEAADRPAEALEAMRQMAALTDGRREQLIETIDWLLRRKVWSIVDELAQRHPDRFKNDPFLLYRLAEAQVQRGDKELGEKTAEQAFTLLPMESARHFEVALQLQERGRFAWAEREYRGILKSVEMVSGDGVNARSMLAEMLHDQEQEAEAASVLSDLVSAMEADDTVKDSIEGNPAMRRAPSEIISRMYFFASLDHIKHQRFDEARAAMEKGVTANEEDADLLIAMYHLPQADDDWKLHTTELIEKSVDSFKSMVEQMQRAQEDAEDDLYVERARAYMAMYCNQYAWLVGNTKGDIDEAIRLSKLSLEVTNNPSPAGYMDTLAHCYYAKGDYKNAVHWQSRAVELDPHSGAINRALARFQKALAAQTKE